MGRLEGKGAVVLGAAGKDNMGQVIARRFAAEGAKVLVAGRKLEPLQALADEIAGCAAVCDIVNRAQVFALAETAKRKLGAVDVAVNAAAIAPLIPFLDNTEEQLKTLSDVLFVGPFFFMQAMIQAMDHGGSIIQISSATATIQLNDHAAYQGGKAAADHVVRCAANEFGARDIRINSISPGLTDTPMTAGAKSTPGIYEAFLPSYPLGRIGTCEDIAAAAVFLASDECFMTGQNLQVNGGLTLRRNPTREEITASVMAHAGGARLIDVAEARSLGDVVRLQARARPDAIVFEFEGRLTSFGAFDQHTNQVANGLIALELEPGDRIAYLGKNSDVYFEIVYGAAKAGVVMAPINWRLAPPEIAYIVRDAGAKVLFVGPEFIDQARGLLPQFDTPPVVVATEGGAPDWRAFQTWRDRQAPSDPQTTVGWEDIALQLYTSGTTGHPKGAMLSHRALLGARRVPGAGDIEWNRWTSEDVSLVAMPVFHIGGTGWGSLGVYNGARGVIAREFDPGRVLDFIENSRITKMFMVPAAMQIVVRSPRAREVDYSCLKYLLYGASPIPLDLLKECMEVFGCGFVQMYGMTETTGTIVALPPEDHDPAGNPRMRSAGKALPGVEIVILDEAGNRLPAGQVGEIATRSLANMTGYWNLPDATAKTIDADGWLRTGDAGYLDEDGYVFIHDRVKDMIITGGENVYPAEVENAIFGHPGIADVAVIGIPDERWGEAVKAVVVRKAGAHPTPAQIIAWARERIAAYKAPKSVDYIDALPRNASGKILRRELREAYWKGHDRRVS